MARTDEGSVVAEDDLLQEVVRPVRSRVPVYWALGSELEGEIRAWMLRGLEPTVLRPWIEKPARQAFDSLIEALLVRGVEVAQAYAAAGLPPLKRALKQLDDAKAGVEAKAAKRVRFLARVERRHSNVEELSKRIKKVHAVKKLLGVSLPTYRAAVKELRAAGRIK